MPPETFVLQHFARYGRVLSLPVAARMVDPVVVPVELLDDGVFGHEDCPAPAYLAVLCSVCERRPHCMAAVSGENGCRERRMYI